MQMGHASHPAECSAQSPPPRPCNHSLHSMLHKNCNWPNLAATFPAKQTRPHQTWATPALTAAVCRSRADRHMSTDGSIYTAETCKVACCSKQAPPLLKQLGNKGQKVEVRAGKRPALHSTAAWTRRLDFWWTLQRKAQPVSPVA